jgi:NAD+ kinase
MAQSVGIMANAARGAAVECAAGLAAWLRERGVEVRLQARVAEAAGEGGRAAAEEELGQAGLLVAVGGDGTLLAASRLAAPYGTPILGVHVGGPASFGFMTETTPPAARAAVEQALEGRYSLDERMMVACSIFRDNAPVARYFALNDLVISKSALARMLKLRIAVSGTFIATYAADGIIVASPTGSTAYNLAAGGPLVHPAVQVILLTPICPHTLNVRSLIIGDRETIDVEVEEDPREAPLLTVDGQVGFELRPGDRVQFHRAEFSARLVVLDGPNFYQKVHTRLRLGERFGA